MSKPIPHPGCNLAPEYFLDWLNRNYPYHYATTKWFLETMQIAMEEDYDSDHVVNLILQADLSASLSRELAELGWSSLCNCLNDQVMQVSCDNMCEMMI